MTNHDYYPEHGVDSQPCAAGGTDDTPQVPAEDGESRYRRRPASRPGVANPDANRVWRPMLAEPDTVAMTEQQHEQAVDALSAMIVTWLRDQARRRRAQYHGDQPPES